MEFFAKCHTIVIPMASCIITTRQTLAPIGSVGHGVFCMNVWSHMNIWLKMTLIIMTLALGLWSKLRHENGEWVVRVSQDLSINKCGRVQGSESQPFPNEKHFESYSPLVILNFWDKSVYSKHGPNWAPNIPLKSSWSINIESGIHKYSIYPRF